MSTHHRFRPAFTIIELLVVLGIVMIVLSILLPALGSARRQAKATTTLGNIRQCGQAVTSYCDDNRGLFPTLFEPRLVFRDLELMRVKTPRGTLRGGWFSNAGTWQFALPNPLPAEVVSDMLRPRESLVAPTDHREETQSDFALSFAFYARPDYWHWRTQRGPEQWRTMRLDSIRHPSNKGMMLQMRVYDVPGWPDGFMACCATDYPTGILWSDLAAERVSPPSLRPGAPNPWHHGVAGGLPPWAKGSPVLETEYGVEGRDR
ncbi:MAG: type II secretion system protein [Phycisphaerales bacterium]|nr:type II secretion system protein [Phycisphaerales bacterium]